ncbi:MAG: DNA replication/repair protein RecF [Proteobacteria bacterium]|nr:DNA replication/repair protein RecF [Pseudomonadota bacterium]
MIEELYLRNFRNYGEARLSFSSGINLFCGENGQGKTNLLEAIYLLGMLSSFRKAEAASMVKKGEETFCISGDFTGDGAYKLLLEKGPRGWEKISANGSLYRKKLDYLGKIRIVVFSPDEIELIQGSPEGRRRYIDRTCFNTSHHYLKQLKNYRRVLKQRNILLKKGIFRGEEFGTWTERLALAGAKIVKERAALIEKLNQKLSEGHPFLGTDSIKLRYVGTCTGDEMDVSQGLLDKLTSSSHVERCRRTTVSGPHRDDIEISVNGTVAKAFSSRGEMRSVLLALKTAETALYDDIWGESPLILLDDVASELDIGRRSALISFLREKGNQVLMTTTEAENIPLFGNKEDTLFRVSEGKIIH